MRISELKNIPGVDALLSNKKVKPLVSRHGHSTVVFFIRNILEQVRTDVRSGEPVPDQSSIIELIESMLEKFSSPALREVINATGIILHTNLGRAPLGKNISDAVRSVVEGYSNLEFDLNNAKRGSRGIKIKELIKILTGAEDAIVVNNNAAGVFLCLKTFAEYKKVLVSRGELVEIGDSFRIPEIIAGSGVVMKEVGTTNRTRPSDYENAIDEDTKIILKTHQSNYYIEGFTEEVDLQKLSGLSKKNNLLLLYDLGSGLLKKYNHEIFAGEPDVATSITQGADLVTFSCDKLLGGPQAGIIAGKKELVQTLAKTPLMRTLRVDKITISFLCEVLKQHLSEEKLFENIPIYKMLNRSDQEVKSAGKKLVELLKVKGIDAELMKSHAVCGGGTLPQAKINSYCIELKQLTENKAESERIFCELLKLERPVLGILRQGRFLIDLFAISPGDLTYIAESLKRLL